MTAPHGLHLYRRVSTVASIGRCPGPWGPRCTRVRRPCPTRCNPLPLGRLGALQKAQFAGRDTSHSRSLLRRLPSGSACSIERFAPVLHDSRSSTSGGGLPAARHLCGHPSWKLRPFALACTSSPCGDHLCDPALSRRRPCRAHPPGENPPRRARGIPFALSRADGTSSSRGALPSSSRLAVPRSPRREVRRYHLRT